MHQRCVVGFDSTKFLAHQTCPIEKISVVFIIRAEVIRLSRSEIVKRAGGGGGVLYYWNAPTESFLHTDPDTINIGDSACYNVFLLNSLINGKARPIDFGNVILLNPIFVRQRSTGWN